MLSTSDEAKDVIPHPLADAGSSVGLGYALGSAVSLGLVDALTTTPRDAGFRRTRLASLHAPGFGLVICEKA